MASAKDGHPEIARVFQDEFARLKPEDQPERERNWVMFAESLDEQLVAEVVDALRLTHQIVEVVVRAPLAARNFHPGEFYRLQNYETFAEEVDGIKLTMEGIALTGAWVDRERGLISLIVLEMGGSSRLCSLLEPGEKVVLMGPTGTPTEIPHDQTVVLAGGGLGNAVLFSIALALKEKNNKVIYFAGYRAPTDLFKRQEIEKACDVVVWSTDRGPCIQPARPQDRTFLGNIVEAMQAYASGQLGEQPIPLADAQRIIAIGSDRMMAAVKHALADKLSKHFPNQPTAIGSINSPMQCMMKEICAQCLQRHVDPETQEGILRLQLLQPGSIAAIGRFHQPEHPAPPKQRRGETDFAVDRSPVLGAVGADVVSSKFSRGSQNRAALLGSELERNQAMSKRVSLCMIVKNEEANLTGCLEPLAGGLFHELIVVDTGSTDRTKEVARKLGAKVFDFPWCDNFAAARNQCLRHATGEWVFTYDADDYFDAANRTKLRTLLAKLPDGLAGYNMIRHCPPGPDGSGESSIEMMRLFPNHPQVRWQYHVHEQVIPALVRLGAAIHSTDIVIHHHGYQDPNMMRRKLERNLRLLRAAVAEYPDDPFMLYYLGRTSLAFEKTDEALPLLRRSLELAHPDVPFMRKLFAQLARGYYQKGNRDAALAMCVKGRERFADDAELLFLESMLRNETGDLKGAEACLLELLRPGACFVHEDASLCGFKAKQNLGVVYQRQGRPADAEAQFRTVMAERPDFVPAWLALTNLYLTQRRWSDLETTIAAQEHDSRRATDAALLRARGQAMRREYAAARATLQRALVQAPKALPLRLTLSRVLMEEWRELSAVAEEALRSVLELDRATPRAAPIFRSCSASNKKEGFMRISLSANQRQLLAELEGLLEEYYPLLLQMIRTYRDSVLLQPAAASVRRGWKEAQRGETLPIERLWEGIDVE